MLINIVCHTAVTFYIRTGKKGLVTMAEVNIKFSVQIVKQTIILKGLNTPC